MVNIDTVYQKVLALANKEQRGYVTPQEFNLLANKAQLDIYGNYFHNLKMAYHKPTKTQTVLGVTIWKCYKQNYTHLKQTLFSLK